RRRQLGDQHRGLADDRVDEELDVHLPTRRAPMALRTNDAAPDHESMVRCNPERITPSSAAARDAHLAGGAVCVAAAVARRATDTARAELARRTHRTARATVGRVIGQIDA